MLDRGPLQNLYNVIYYNMHDFTKQNEYGYAVTSSHTTAIRIWPLASDWECLITREPFPKQAVLGLVIHRMTGSKEVVNMLHKFNHIISSQDIRSHNLAWSIIVSSRQLLLSCMRKGTRNIVRFGTTHDTNKTLFQLPSKEEKESIPEIGSQVERQLDICDSEDIELLEAVPFHIV